MKPEELQGDTTKRIEAALAEGRFTKEHLAVAAVLCAFKTSRNMLVNAQTPEQRAYALGRVENAFTDMTILAAQGLGVPKDTLFAATDFIMAQATEQVKALIEGGMDARAAADAAVRAHEEGKSG